MFEVRATFEFDHNFPIRDAEVMEAAGRQSEFSGAGACRDLGGGREHGWHEPDFAAAMQLKVRLEAVPGLIVRVREAG